MKNYLFKDRDGQTPLPEELQKGLIPKHIQTIGELDEYEEENIAKGILWLERFQGNDLVYTFWLDLHKKLFGDVWRWAGKVRKHDVSNPDFLSFPDIWPALRQLEGDIQYWFAHKPFSSFETLARFHERIETIHPFANGNGRFGRILAEHVCQQRKIKIPTWGEGLKDEPIKRRKTYVDGLYKGRHDGNYKNLIEFMYS